MDPVTAIYILVAALVISVALAPKPPAPKPPELSDLQAPTAEEGKAIPVVFGDAWVKGSNCVWYGDLRSTPIQKKAGKK